MGRHFAEGDDGGGEMVERDEAALELLVPHEQLAKAVKPAVADLDYPPSSLLLRVAPLVVSLLTAIDNMRDVTMIFDGAKMRCTAVTRVGAQMLISSLRRAFAIDDDGTKHVPKRPTVMDVGPGHDERQRDTTTVHQQMSLAAFFSPDPSDLARPLPVPMAPSSSRRRRSANAKRCPPSGRTQPDRLSTTTQRSPQPPTLGSACGWRLRYQNVPWAVPSIGSQCEARKQWPRTPTVQASVVDPLLACAHRPGQPRSATESAVRPAPRSHQSLPMIQRACPRFRSIAALAAAQIGILPIYG